MFARIFRLIFANCLFCGLAVSHALQPCRVILHGTCMLLGAVIPVARSRPQLYACFSASITLARSKVTGNTDIEYEVRYYLDLSELSLEAS
jgi:hypothetical protein